MPTLPALTLDLLLVALLVFLGLRIVHLMAPGITWLESLGVSLPLGAGSLTYAVFLLSWMGIPVSLGSFSAAGLVLLAFAEAASRWKRGVEETAVGENRRSGGAGENRLARWCLWIVMAALAVVTTLISVGRSHTLWDAAAIWAAKGYGIALEGTIFAAKRWGAHAAAYPLNIPLLISMFQLADGDVLPGSKLVFPLFFVSTLFGIAGFWRRLRVPDLWVLVGIVLTATIPEVFRHATYGYANIPLATYLVLGALWGARGLRTGRVRYTILAGSLLSLAIWTRVEGVLYVAAILAPFLVSWAWARLDRLHLLALFAPIAVVGLPWLSFFLTNGISGSQTGGAMAAAIEHWRLGDFRWNDLRLILGYLRRSLLHTEVWGLLFPTSVGLLALRWRRFLDRAVPEIMILGVAALTTGIATVGLFYVGSYVKDGLFAWLTRSFPRAFFPSAILLATIAFSAIAGEGMRRAGDSSGTAAAPSPLDHGREPDVAPPTAEAGGVARTATLRPVSSS